MIKPDLINRNKNINRGYRKLEVWQEAIDFYVLVKKKVRKLSEVPYKIRAQVEDSAYSCPSNIAEGYGRRGLKESIQFNNVALASLAENYTQIFALLEGDDIDRKWFDEYDAIHYKLENKLINYNKSQIKQLKENVDWKNDYVIRDIVEKYDVKEVE
ncbi:MAG: four helix bundle protein [Melioribacteraceae bacterium]|nr:four helix bundle protein [Saprospiraceae bacterium]MCF8394803.1 four helix bundle protein [Melioribacteraceae bacterium]